MASGACAVIGEANASTPPQQTHEIFLAEEEISDVSLTAYARTTPTSTNDFERRSRSAAKVQ
jgi:hypothetical protein